MSNTEERYSLKVKNDSKKYGNICVFQTSPDQPDNILSLAWFSKAAHPDTSVEFDWNTNYNFVWSDQGELRPGTTFKASQISEPDSPPPAYAGNKFTECDSSNLSDGIFNVCESNGICEEENTKPPKYYVVFGDYKEGDIIDISALENAVELNLEDLGKTVVINNDNSISIE